jgi:hypothetical protein
MLKADIGILGDWDLEIRELGDWGQKIYNPISQYLNLPISKSQYPNFLIAVFNQSINTYYTR